MTQEPSPPEHRPQVQEAAQEHPQQPHVVPIGTLMVVAVLMLTLIWLWMLVLGIQQGRG